MTSRTSWKALGTHPQLMVGWMAGSGRRLVTMGGAPGAPLSCRTAWLPATPCCICCNNKPSRPATRPVCSAALQEQATKARQQSGARHPTQGRGSGHGKLILGLLPQGQWVLVPSTVRVSSHASSTNSQPRGARGLPAKDNLLYFQKNTAEKSVSVLHAQTFFQHTAFPGTPGEGFGERQGKTSWQRKGSVMRPATPFPTSLPPRGQAALQKEQLGKAHGAIPRAGNMSLPRHSPYGARTRETAAIAGRLWERGPWAGRLKSKAGGVVGSALTKVFWGRRVLWPLGHSDTVMLPSRDPPP